jgi:molybdate transport system substrate-binding protein
MSAPRRVVRFLCAGAAQGLLKALEGPFAAQTGARLEGRFGAVGALKEALVGGEPCDVMIVTEAMIDALAQGGRLDASSKAVLGRVRTGVAVRAGDAPPAVGTPEALRAALLAADRIYFPDPERATAGIHFAAVLRKLGLHDRLAGRFATHPNGATAMRELAAATDASPIGCTQITEINYTPGVRLAGALPREFELATVYAAALTTQPADRALAARLIESLAGAESEELRRAGGFEVEAAS